MDGGGDENADADTRQKMMATKPEAFMVSRYFILRVVLGKKLVTDPRVEKQVPANFVRLECDS